MMLFIYGLKGNYLSSYQQRTGVDSFFRVLIVVGGRGVLLRESFIYQIYNSSLENYWTIRIKLYLLTTFIKKEIPYKVHDKNSISKIVPENYVALIFYLFTFKRNQGSAGIICPMICHLLHLIHSPLLSLQPLQFLHLPEHFPDIQQGTSSRSNCILQIPRPEQMIVCLLH